MGNNGGEIESYQVLYEFRPSLLKRHVRMRIRGTAKKTNQRDFSVVI